MTPPDSLRLLALRVDWEDTSPFGTTLSGRVQDFIRSTLHPQTTRELLRRPRRASLGELTCLVRRERRLPPVRKILDNPHFWRPPAKACVPVALELESPWTGARARITAGGPLALAIAEPALGSPEEILLRRLLSESEGSYRLHSDSVRPRGRCKGPTVIGHACVTVSDGTIRLWTDPFLFAKTPRYGRHYQPLGPSDFVEAEHVVLLTHSHPDHFDPGSLLRFPVDTLFVVPHMGEESLLSVDLEFRLRQLGFSRIHVLDWWERLRIGGFEVTALPFHGEQPLERGDRLDLREFNRGNTYLIREPNGRSNCLLADSGSDPRMTSEGFAEEVRSRAGTVDLLFANHRRWALYPVQYLRTSVPQFLCYVPDHRLAERQSLMLDPSRLARMAAVLRARVVVPYAMGGARWHEELGLGYDIWTRRSRSTAFDSNPRDLIAHIGPGGPRVSVAAPGQRVRLARPPALVCGLRRPSTHGSSKSLPSAAFPACLTYTAPLRPEPELLRAIWRILRLDPSGFVIAAPGFGEVCCSRNRAGRLVLHLVEEYLGGRTGRVLVHDRPFTVWPFEDRPVLLAHFRRLHAAALNAEPRAGRIANLLDEEARRAHRRSLPFRTMTRLIARTRHNVEVTGAVLLGGGPDSDTAKNGRLREESLCVSR